MSDAPVAPTPAATVIPLRDSPDGLEVLMLRRNSRGAFGGMWVFPGGQVDQSDRPGGGGPTEGGRGTESDELAAARQAAVREAFEEAGVVIEPSVPVVLSFWLPPPEAPRRFATWFFLAPVAAAHDVVIDQVEIHDHRWMRPADVLDARDAHEMELAPPTFTTLWWLSRYTDTTAAMEAAAAQPEPGRFETHVAVSADGVGATLWAGDAGYEDGDTDRPGPRRRLVMGPGRWRVEITP